MATRRRRALMNTAFRSEAVDNQEELRLNVISGERPLR
jgi:hypothetical protein